MKRPFALGCARKCPPASAMEKKKDPRVVKRGRIPPAQLSGRDLRARRSQWNQSRQRKGAENGEGVPGGPVCQRKEVAGKQNCRHSAKRVSEQIRTAGAQFKP